MNIQKTLVAVAATSILGAIAGCSSDSDSGTPTSPVGASTAISTAIDNRTSVGSDASCTVGTYNGFDIDGKPSCALSSGTRIGNDVTLSAAEVYDLQGYVRVGFGDLATESAADVTLLRDNPVTMTIPAGTQFRSSGSGTLVISRGSKLLAQGTAAAPIVMSSRDADFDGRGEWGGLVVQGMAKNNKCPSESTADVCNTADEAGTGNHGGNDDADNSGSIQYLIVAEGGFEVAPDEEINGITLHSVGYGTTIENIMVHNNADDGIEFFGGAVNVKNLVLTQNGDESIDWDDGYRGNIQFAVVRQGSGADAGDHGIEADNKGASTTAIPVSNPSLGNISFKGTVDSDDAVRLKEGTGGSLTNVAFDDYTDFFLIEEVDTGANATGPIALTNLVAEFSGTQLTVKDGNTATAGSLGLPVSTAFDLDAAFALPSALGDLAVAATFTSANAVTDFFDQSAGAYVGAVAPGTAAGSAWWQWAQDAIPGSVIP